MAKAIIPTPYLTDIKDERKAKLELVINAAARWGFLQARAGTDEFPNSIIEWTDADIPSIVDGDPP